LGGDYKIELDIFSGNPNPCFDISKDDFLKIYNEVNNLKESPPAPVFDGLGFRGIILKDRNSVLILIQKNIIRLEENGSVKFYSGNTEILKSAFEIFRNYDKEKNYDNLCKELIASLLS